MLFKVCMSIATILFLIVIVVNIVSSIKEKKKYEYLNERDDGFTGTAKRYRKKHPIKK